MENRVKKKLLVTASTFPRWKGDTEPRFVLDLASHMTESFDVTVLVPSAFGAKDYEEMEGVKVIRFHYFPVRRWETLCYPGAIVPRIREKKIRAFLVPFLLVNLYINLFKLLPKYDLVHAHWIIPQGIIQSFYKKNYIVTGHGGDVTSLNQGILKKLKIRCLQKADYVTVVSGHLKKEVNKLCWIDNIRIMPMGCDTAKFGRQHYRMNCFGQEEQKVVLFVGRLAEKKGVTYLIEAMERVDALLVIVGDGPLKEALEHQAEQYNDKIKFIGPKTHDQLKELYASADILVMPSITAKDGDEEGFGLVILEAMASGLPVVASNSGGISSLVQDGSNGLLCEQKNTWELSQKMNMLLENETLYSKIKNNGEMTAEKYDYSVIAKQYCDLLMLIE